MSSPPVSCHHRQEEVVNMLDADVDPDDTYRYRHVLYLIDPDAANPGQAERLLLTPSGEPSTLSEAKGDENWRQANSR